MEVDNHAVELAVEYVCATGPSTFATWTSLTGVMTFAYGTWDLIARDEFDVVGGTAKTPSSVGAVPVTIMQILQDTVKYGNSDTVTGPYTVPPHVLGTGETNSEGVAGYGGYAMAGQPDAPWVQGSCPPYSVLDWMDDAGNKTQNLCACYPPNYYDPNAGSQGSGTTYVTVTGVIQGIDSDEGPFYICDESCPTTGGCMFTYRRSSTKLNLGDKVQMTAKVYARPSLLVPRALFSSLAALFSAPPFISSPLLLQGLCILWPQPVFLYPRRGSNPGQVTRKIPLL